MILKKRKNSQEIMTTSAILNLIKSIYKRPTLILYSMVKKCVPPKIRNTASMSTLTIHIQHNTGSSSQHSKTRKRSKKAYISKRKELTYPYQQITWLSMQKIPKKLPKKFFTNIVLVHLIIYGYKQKAFKGCSLGNDLEGIIGNLQ